MKYLLLCKILFGLSLLSRADTIALFDGKSLEGWEGDARFWSVQDGVITGKSTEQQPFVKPHFWSVKNRNLPIANLRYHSVSLQRMRMQGYYIVLIKKVMGLLVTKQISRQTRTLMGDSKSSEVDNISSSKVKR